MSSTSENETDIVLGNAQLLGIFFVLAVLLGVAFTGGYMVGRNGADKRAAAQTAGVDPAASTLPGSGGETHSVDPASDDSDSNTHATPPPQQQPAPAPEVAAAAPVVKPPVASNEASPLGTPHTTAPPAHQISAPPPPKPAPKPPKVETPAERFTAPQGGQTFLQVAAVGHTEANALAQVLSRKGFRAHAVAKPGTELYRVLIGPMRDASDLSTTRDSLRNAGFTKIFVQRY